MPHPADGARADDAAAAVTFATVLDAADLTRIIDRLAHQICEHLAKVSLPAALRLAICTFTKSSRRKVASITA